MRRTAGYGAELMALRDALQEFLWECHRFAAVINADAVADSVAARVYGRGYSLIVKMGWREGQSLGRLGAVPYAGPAFDENGLPRGARATDAVAGIGWVDDANDRYCWPIEFLQADVPRPVAVPGRFDAWWYKGFARRPPLRNACRQS